MQHTVYLFDGFQLDVTRRKLISSGGLVQPLNSRAMDTLLLLLENAGELVEKRRLMQTVWPNAIVEDNNLNQCVLAIRKALGEAAGSNRYIMTVPGRGYRFVNPVHAVVRESTSEAEAAPGPRRGSAQLRWLGVALGTTGGVCALTLILLLRFAHQSDDAVMSSSEPTARSGQSVPEIVLRLHDLPGAGRDTTTVDSTAALTRCLAEHPDLKLRMRIQLLTEEGDLVWNGDYAAGTQLPIAVTNDERTRTSGCRELIATLHPARRNASSR